MAVKTKQLEDGALLMGELRNLIEVEGAIRVINNKLVISIPVVGTFVPGEIVESESGHEEGNKNELIMSEPINSDNYVTMDKLYEELQKIVGNRVATKTIVDIIDTLNNCLNMQGFEITPNYNSGRQICKISINDREINLAVDISDLAPINNPVLIGTPKAPTPGSLSDDSTIATTAFVKRVLSAVIGTNVNIAIKNNIDSFVEETLERYNQLNGSTAELEQNFSELLEKLQDPTATVESKISLINTIQDLLSTQESKQTEHQTIVNNYITQLSQNDNVNSELISLIERYRDLGVSFEEINNAISDIINDPKSTTDQQELISRIELFITNTVSNKESTTQQLETVLIQQQDIVTIVQRLLKEYDSLPSTTKAINEAVKALQEGMDNGVSDEDLKALATELSNTIKDYKSTNHELTNEDRDIQEFLKEIKDNIASETDAIKSKITDLGFEEQYAELINLIEDYKESGKVNKQIENSLERLNEALRIYEEDPSNPFAISDVEILVNAITSKIQEDDSNTLEELMDLITIYRLSESTDSTIDETITRLLESLNDDTSTDDSDDTLQSLIESLKEKISEQEEEKQALQENFSSTVEEKKEETDPAIKTIKDLSAAIGDDPDFVNHVQENIAQKVDSSGGEITGDLTVTGIIKGDVTGNITGNLEGIASTAVSDVNGKDITTYVNGISLNGYTLLVTNGAGSTVNLELPDGSENIIEYSLVTTSKDGLMRKEDYNKLLTVEEGANNFTYILPTAKTDTLGGVMIGNNISIDATGKISLTAINVTNALGYTPVDSTSLVSNTTALNTAMKSYVNSISVNGSTLSVTDGNGTVTTFNVKDTTYETFVGSNSNSAGKMGLVPAPDKGSTNKYLSSTGSWTTISASDISNLQDYIVESTYDLSDYLGKQEAALRYAPINSPTLTGNPKSVTPADDSNDTSIATTAFVYKISKTLQPLSDPLSSISNLTTDANKIIYTTESNKYATTTLSPFMREVLSQTSAQLLRNKIGAINSEDNIKSATKLHTARSIKVNLESNDDDPFDGTADITPGVSGVLSEQNGGTGNSNLSNVTVGTANKLTTPVTIELEGAVQGSVVFDGSSNVKISTTAAMQQETTQGTSGDNSSTGIDMSKSMLADGREYSRVRFYQETPNYGALEIAVADNGNEPIYVRQYKRNPEVPQTGPATYDNAFYENYRTLTLIDGEGNSEFPGIITAQYFKGTAESATKFKDDVNLTTDLSSDNVGVINGTKEFVDAGVKGVLPIKHGGTGGNTVALARNSLGLGNTAGPVPVANGGTGVATLDDIRNSLKLGQTIDSPVPIKSGGTGLSQSPWLSVNLASNNEVDILVTDPRPGVKGILAPHNGGTGQDDLSKVTVGQANKLSEKRTITLANDAKGSIKFDGSEDLSFDVTVNSAAVSNEAIKLSNSRTFRTNLGSEEAVTFNGTTDNVHGVEGVLPVSHGGTGLSQSPAMIVNLSSNETKSILVEDPSPGVTGILNVNNGGTGQNNLDNVTVGQAKKISQKVTINLIGAVTGSTNFDGSGNVDIPTQLNAADKSPTMVICESAASVSNKIVTVANFSLREGIQIAVKFINGNTSNGMTLNVNNLGAYPIYTKLTSTNDKPFSEDSYGNVALTENSIVHLTLVDTGEEEYVWLISLTDVMATQDIPGIIDNKFLSALLAKCYPVSSTNYNSTNNVDFGGIHFGICTDAETALQKVARLNQGSIPAVKGDIFAIRFINGHKGDSLSLSTDTGFTQCEVKGPLGIVKYIPKNTLVFFTALSEIRNNRTVFYYNLDYICYHNLYDYVFEVETDAVTVTKTTVVKSNDISSTWIKKDGSKVIVKFSVLNTAVNPTLKINNETALPMYLNDGTRITGKTLTEGVWEFIYLSSGISGEGYYVPSSTLASYHNRPILNRFSIPKTAWVQDSSVQIADYIYHYDINAPGVVDTDIPVVSVDIHCQELAQVAELCGTAETLTDTIRLYCEYEPEGVISGTYFTMPSR